MPSSASPEASAPAKALELAEKWFGDIRRGGTERIIPMEPAQTAARFQKVEADVPVNLVYQVFHGWTEGMVRSIMPRIC